MFRQIIVLLAFCHQISGYGTGAPPGACQSMTPNHPSTSPQTSDAPYQLQLSSNMVRVGEAVQVTLQGVGDQMFKGFLIKAVNTNSDAVGSFTTIPGDAQTVDCGAAMSSVTHNAKDEKSSITFTWTAPETATSLQFLYTVVQQKDTYWVKEALNVTVHAADQATSSTAATTSSTTPMATSSTTSGSESSHLASYVTVMSAVGALFLALL